MIDLTESVECPYCKANIKQNWSDYTEQEVCERAECGMGNEVLYHIDCDEFRCPKCGEIFSVSGWISEYPEETYNDSELTSQRIRR